MSTYQYLATPIVLISFFALGCDGATASGTDSGPDVADAARGIDGGQSDSGSVTDAGNIDAGSTGPDPTDPCASNYPASYPGCNGFLSEEPPTGAAFGACGAERACDQGLTCHDDLYPICLPRCTPGDSDFSTGGCPTGFRCLRAPLPAAPSWCVRDCDATHPCTGGWSCTGRGYCVSL